MPIARKLKFIRVIEEAKPEEKPEVKLLGPAKRPTEAQLFGRKPRVKTHRRTCAELREDRRLQWLAKKTMKEAAKMARKREKEARDERRRQRQERREAFGY